MQASRVEIQGALNAWYDYLAKKLQANPDISHGISPKLINGDRTIRLSLVDIIAPELDGLGRLVDAKSPQAYVEGARSPEIYIQFQGIYYHEKHPVTHKPLPFTSDPENELSSYLGYQGIVPYNFLLHIYSSNDLDDYGKFRNLKRKDLVFFIDNYNSPTCLSLDYFSVSSGRFSIIRKTSISRAESTDLWIVRESFKHASSKLM